MVGPLQVEDAGPGPAASCQLWGAVLFPSWEQWGAPECSKGGRLKISAVNCSQVLEERILERK